MALPSLASFHSPRADSQASSLLLASQLLLPFHSIVLVTLVNAFVAAGPLGYSLVTFLFPSPLIAYRETSSLWNVSPVLYGPSFTSTYPGWFSLDCMPPAGTFPMSDLFPAKSSVSSPEFDSSSVHSAG